MRSGDHPRSRPAAGCALCEGICPRCGGPVGAKAGSLDWVLCSPCHETFRHTHAPRRFVLTGPPGSGKTAIVAELAARRIRTVAEPARVVLARERATDGPGVPERSPQLFCELMLAQALADREAAESGVVVFDRGIPDLIGYAQIFGLSTEPFERAARTYRYDELVFSTDAWPDIYTTDDERTMTFEQAADLGARTRAAYERHGYTIVDLARASVAERAAVIADAIGVNAGDSEGHEEGVR